MNAILTLLASLGVACFCLAIGALGQFAVWYWKRRGRP